VTRTWLASFLFALSLVPAPAGAEEEDPPPAAEPAASPASEPSRSLRERFPIRLGWDRGPTYQLDLVIPYLAEWSPFGLFDSPTVRGRFGGELYLDGGWVGGDADEHGLEAEVRRARFNTSGSIVGTLRTEYRFAFQIESSSVFLNDFYLRWRPLWLRGAWLRFGYFEPALSLGAVGGSGERVFLESAGPVSAFAPSYRSGVELAGTWTAPDLSWALALTTVGQDQEEGDASDNALRLGGRLVWRPWRIEAGSKDSGGEPSLLHLGVGFGHTLSGSGVTRYRSRPESRLVDYVVDTGDIDGDATLLNIEAAWRRGPFSLEGEVFQSFVDASDADARFGGAYVQAAWVLTGEYRPYDPIEAQFKRVVPRRPFSPRLGQYGALEVALRLAWLDLEDGPIRGGRLGTVGAALGWTLTRNVRILAGFTYADVTGRLDVSKVYVVSSRLELRF
jgi:phosphate-selective porin OprO/OprP